MNAIIIWTEKVLYGWRESPISRVGLGWFIPAILVYITVEPLFGWIMPDPSESSSFFALAAAMGAFYGALVELVVFMMQKDTAMVEILQTSGVLVSPFLGLVWALVAFLVVSRNCEVTFMALVNLLLLSGVYVATSSVAYLIGNTTIARFLGAEE